MKYFTPELHSRFCSVDEQVADLAHAEWERALARYERRLKKVRAQMPPSVQQLCDGLRLHDAVLLFLGRQEARGAPTGASGICHLALQVGPPRNELVLLAYELTKAPRIEVDRLPAELRSSQALFLYDEIDAAARQGERHFTHTILFGNGLHLELSFRDVQVQVEQQLLPIPDRVVPRSA